MLQSRVSKLTVMFCYGFVIKSVAAGQDALECHPTVILEIQSRRAAVGRAAIQDHEPDKKCVNGSKGRFLGGKHSAF